MKLFSLFAGYRLWDRQDFYTQRAVIFTILAVVCMLAVFGLIKFLIHFYKLPRKDKKDVLLAIPIVLIGLFILTYFILYFTFPARWDLNIGVVSVVSLGIVSLFFVAIVFDDSILEKTDTEVEKKESELNDTDPEVERKESEDVYWEDLKEKAEKNFSSWFSKKSNTKSDIESRLEKLTQLLNDNLISKEEYEEQRKKIIGDV